MPFSADELKAWLGAWAIAPLLIACFGLVAATFFEQSQLIAKAIGAHRRQIATGYNNAMKLMVANRAGAIGYFFMIAIAIDLGTSAETIQSAFAATMVLIALSSTALFLYHRKLERASTALASFAPTQASAEGFTHRETLALWGALGATVLNLAGLTIPMIWSATYPDLRLTLANTGFLFNTIFTLINVFLVESEVARQIDENPAGLHPFVARILLIKIVGALAAIPVVVLP